MLAMVNDLSACIGACERIVQTPVPEVCTRSYNIQLKYTCGARIFIRNIRLREYCRFYTTLPPSPLILINYQMYARHTSRFLCLWIFTLPLLLLPEMGFWVVPAIACISWTLFGIQELGLQLENPFVSIIKLDVMEEMNQQSVDETLSLADDYELLGASDMAEEALIARP
ncbi:hypothetical protein T492DRAFT_1086197 [Pavlovales sp. CCMP2436]|nr:hypothetical protein T492DRAFT_1086197 [Pavlovales sp. CCMP2436]